MTAAKPGYAESAVCPSPLAQFWSSTEGTDKLLRPAL
jgi:hypothetical protein